MTTRNQATETPDQTAVALFQALHAGDWMAARRRFTARFRAALGETELASVWRQVTAQLGALQEATVIDRTDYGDIEVRVVALVFAKGTAVGRVSFQTPTGQVEGLSMEDPALPS
jgi:hypothetical protein